MEKWGCQTKSKSSYFSHPKLSACTSDHWELELQTSELIFVGLLVSSCLFYFIVFLWWQRHHLLTLYGITFNIWSAGTLLEPLGSDAQHVRIFHALFILRLFVHILFFFWRAGKSCKTDARILSQRRHISFVIIEENCIWKICTRSRFDIYRTPRGAFSFFLCSSPIPRLQIHIQFLCSSSSALAFLDGKKLLSTPLKFKIKNNNG